MSRRIDERSCEAATELIEPYLDGELGPSESARLEAHLARCTDCAGELELAATIRRELRALPELDCPPAVLERAHRAATEATVVPLRRAAPAGERPRRAWAALAAALVLAVLGAFLVARGLRAPAGQGPSPEEVARATAEARYALAYVGRVSRSAGATLRDDVLAPHVAGVTTEALNRSLAQAGLAGRDETAAGSGGRGD